MTAFQIITGFEWTETRGRPLGALNKDAPRKQVAIVEAVAIYNKCGEFEAAFEHLSNTYPRNVTIKYLRHKLKKAIEG